MCLVIFIGETANETDSTGLHAHRTHDRGGYRRHPGRDRVACLSGLCCSLQDVGNGSGHRGVQDVRVRVHFCAYDVAREQHRSWMLYDGIAVRQLSEPRLRRHEDLVHFD